MTGIKTALYFALKHTSRCKRHTVLRKEIIPERTGECCECRRNEGLQGDSVKFVFSCGIFSPDEGF